jgi:hypothetical protein
MFGNPEKILRYVVTEWTLPVAGVFFINFRRRENFQVLYGVCSFMLPVEFYVHVLCYVLIRRYVT